MAQSNDSSLSSSISHLREKLTSSRPSLLTLEHTDYCFLHVLTCMGSVDYWAGAGSNGIHCAYVSLVLEMSHLMEHMTDLS